MKRNTKRTIGDIIFDAEKRNAESRFDGLKINQTYAIKSSLSLKAREMDGKRLTWL